MSLLIFFVAINLTLGLVSITLAHIAFCIGFVAIVVRSRLAGMDESLVEAARDLGATPWRAFRLITLPLIMPGVIAGALMAFTLSIDDFVVTYFTAGADALTLPLKIYTMVKISVTPEVNAVSTLLMLLTPPVRGQASRLVHIQPHVHEQYHRAANGVDQGAPQRAEIVAGRCWICRDTCEVADCPRFRQQHDGSNHG